MARQRINALAKYRLERVFSELQSIQTENKFKKLDAWNLEQATEMIEAVLANKIHLPGRKEELI